MRLYHATQPEAVAIDKPQSVDLNTPQQPGTRAFNHKLLNMSVTLALLALLMSIIVLAFLVTGNFTPSATSGPPMVASTETSTASSDATSAATGSSSGGGDSATSSGNGAGAAGSTSTSDGTDQSADMGAGGASATPVSPTVDTLNAGILQLTERVLLQAAWLERLDIQLSRLQPSAGAGSAVTEVDLSEIRRQLQQVSAAATSALSLAQTVATNGEHDAAREW